MAKTNFGVIKEQISEIKTDIREIKEALEKNFVTRYEFTPVRNLVYGVVALILTSVVGALVGLVLIKH